VSDSVSAFVGHETPGRLRLKIPSRKGDGAFFEQVQKRLFQCEGIEKVEVNAVTGSILCIHHTSLDAVAAYVRKKKVFDLRRETPGPGSVRQQVSGSFADLNRQIRGAMSGQVELWNLVFLFLIGSGVYQVARGNITAIPWYTAFYYAFNILSKAKNGGAE